MSKPTRNRYYCINAGRTKMLFETQSKANNFIKFNGDDVPHHRQPLRSYYCTCCGGWHITKCHKKKIYDETDGLDYIHVRLASKHKQRLSQKEQTNHEQQKRMVRNREAEDNIQYQQFSDV